MLPEILELLIGHRLEGYEIHGVQNQAVGLAYFNVRVVHTLHPKSKKPLSLHTQFRIPMDENLFKKLDVWLRKQVGKIITRKGLCRKKPVARKGRNGKRS